MKAHEVKQYRDDHGCSMNEAKHELRIRELTKMLLESNRLLGFLKPDLAFLKVLNMHQKILEHLVRNTRFIK